MAAPGEKVNVSPTLSDRNFDFVRTRRDWAYPELFASSEALVVRRSDLILFSIASSFSWRIRYFLVFGVSRTIAANATWHR